MPKHKRLERVVLSYPILGSIIRVNVAVRTSSVFLYFSFPSHALRFAFLFCETIHRFLSFWPLHLLHD